MDELVAGIRRVTLPLPTRPGHVRAYLLPGEEGWTLVDTGVGLPDAKETWTLELAQAGGRVATVFVTHFHPDHVGAAADLHELTGAPVVQGSLDYAQCELVWGNPAWSERLVDWFRLQGAPEDVTDELVGQGSVYRPFIRYQRDPVLVEAGEHVDGWELIAAPGHADGQLCLLRNGILVAADHLLGRITPTVGLWPASRADPLGDYLPALAPSTARSSSIPRSRSRGTAIPSTIRRAVRASSSSTTAIASTLRPTRSTLSHGPATSSPSCSSDRSCPRRDVASPSPRRCRISNASSGRAQRAAPRTTGRLPILRPDRWATTTRLVPAPPRGRSRSRRESASSSGAARTRERVGDDRIPGHRHRALARLRERGVRGGRVLAHHGAPCAPRGASRSRQPGREDRTEPHGRAGTVHRTHPARHHGVRHPHRRRRRAAADRLLRAAAVGRDRLRDRVRDPHVSLGHPRRAGPQGRRPAAGRAHRDRPVRPARRARSHRAPDRVAAPGLREPRSAPAPCDAGPGGDDRVHP